MTAITSALSEYVFSLECSGFPPSPLPLLLPHTHPVRADCLLTANWNSCPCSVQDCIFVKTQDNTTLHVVYQGNIRVHGINACKRWYITLNGAECSGPMPIDAVIWTRDQSTDDYRHGSIEGYCEGVHRGKVRVAINIGNCPGYGGMVSDSGWMSVSRLMIEEVPAPSQQSPPGVPEVPRSRQPPTLDVTARGWGKGSAQPRPLPLAITSRAVAAESEEPGTQPSSPWREESFCLASILWAE